MNRVQAIAAGVATVVAVGVLAVSLNGGDGTTPTPTPSPSPTVTAPPLPVPTAAEAIAKPCGFYPSAPAKYEHVIWIWMENKTLGQTKGKSPYFTGIANKCAQTTHYKEAGSPSLPNYIAATSGSTQGISNNNNPGSNKKLTVSNIFRQVRDRGMTEKSYQESMSGNCALVSKSTYAAKHNPAAYYQGMNDRAACKTNDVPMGTTSSGNFLNDLNNDKLPNFSFITPNLCNDSHDCSVQTGDAWLKKWVDKILATPTYRSGDTAIFLVYDENTYMPNAMVAPYIKPGTKTTTTLTHYSLLRTTEEMLGINTKLGSAKTAPSMRPLFDF